MYETSKIEYVSLTADSLDEAVLVLKKAFFPYENICTALQVAKNPKALDELNDFLIDTANSGVSIVAIDKESGKIAAATVNKLQNKNTSSKTMYEQYIKKATQKEVKHLFEYLVEYEDIVDPFTLYDADCLLELVFLGVLPEFAGRGIGLKLCEVSLELATELCKGNNVKTSLTDTPLPLEPRPQIVTALFTTFKTQKIGRKLNFDILKRVSYADMYINGKPYAGMIRDESEDFTVECKKIG